MEYGEIQMHKRFIMLRNNWILIVLSCLIFGACNRPMANFTLGGSRKAPATIQFENASEQAERYEWDFGDGTTSEEESPSYQYKSSGNYEVVLKAIMGKKTNIKKERIVIDAPQECLVEVETSFGNMLIQLSDATPKHRDNFVKLAEEGFYDGMLFHRVIDGFMIQGGDPDSKDAPKGKALGMGGPGYQVPAEFVDSLVHVKGAIAAARTGDAVNPQKKSSGSQFYIVHGGNITAQMLAQIEARKNTLYSKEQKDAYLENGGTPFLDREYTVFGKVIKGLDVIDKIAQAQTDPRDRPTDDIAFKVRVIK